MHTTKTVQPKSGVTQCVTGHRGFVGPTHRAFHPGLHHNAASFGTTSSELAAAGLDITLAFANEGVKNLTFDGIVAPSAQGIEVTECIAAVMAGSPLEVSRDARLVRSSGT